MRLPPYLLDMRVAPQDGGKPFRLWLPVFLLWPLLLPIVVIAACGTLLADAVLFLAGQRYHYYTFLLAGVLGLLGETRGLVVHVNGDRTNVDVTIV